MSKAILALVMLFSASAFAARWDPCFGPLIEKYKADAKASPDWGFEWLSKVTKKDAKELVSYLEIEDFSEADRKEALELIGLTGTRVYQLDWNAVPTAARASSSPPFRPARS